VFATAAVMAVLRWRHDRYLFLIGSVAFGLAVLGRRARRRRPAGWMNWHGAAMGGSLTASFTGFYIDNGPQLPLWDGLPHAAYWLLPAAVGVPLTRRALTRNRQPTRRRSPDAGGRT